MATCNWLLQVYIKTMNYPTTQSSLLERVQQGDEISWNEFYFRYAPVIRAAGAGFHFNETECDDLIQLVMLKFFTHSKTFVYRKGEVKFRSYFARIIHSQAIDMIRKKVRENDLPGDIPDDPDPFYECFMTEWRKSVLEEAKTELRLRVDPKTYQAYELYVLQERPAAKVAAILDITPNELYAVKNRCNKIMQKIIARHNAADEELYLEL